MTKPYNHRDCLSLFGYSASVHRRSGGICQYCGYGAGDHVDFDLWRQLSVEHLIGEKQKGYLREIKKAVVRRFPELSSPGVERLAKELNDANTVTACSFCNSMTSRDQHTRTMEDLIVNAPGGPSEVLAGAIEELNAIFEAKRDKVRRKLEAVRQAFHGELEHQLNEKRFSGAASVNNSVPRVERVQAFSQLAAAFEV